MDVLTEREIRAALANGSRGERHALTLPPLRDVRWDELDYLGWRDPKAPLRAAVVVPSDQGPRGIVLRAPETRVRKAAQCSVCHLVSQDGVALFVAPRAGAAGRSGSTLGTYICDDLSCSTRLRASVRPSRQLPDPGPVIAARAQDIVRRLDGFVSSVLRP